MSLSEQEIAEFKQMLLEMESATELLLKSLQGGAKPVDLSDPIGRLARVDAIQNQQVSKAQVMRAETQLVLARAALKRVDLGTFGYCVQCEEPIEIGRLKMRPEVTRCFDCQRRMERK